MRVVHANEPSPLQIVGRNILRLREFRGWSQRELASYARKSSKETLSHKTVANIERGEHKTTAGKLIAIADAFEVEVWQLFIPLPEQIGERGADSYLKDQAKLARYLRNSDPASRATILHIARLEQNAKVSVAG
jgi:transcriptional regulator with XRE-family HTH domain